MGFCESFFWVSVALILIQIVLIFLPDKKSDNNVVEENTSGSKDYVYKRNETSGVAGGTNLDRFFIECVLSGCNDFSQEKNIEKAKIFAEKYNLQYNSGIIELYERALEAHEKIGGRILSESLDQKREKEYGEYTRLTKYAEYYGTRKKVAMLTEQKDELNSRASKMKQNADFLLRSTQTRERDWASWGGIASGLAGPGAGVATAMDIQAKNAQIRAQNEANMKAAMPAYMNVLGYVSDSKKYIDLLEKEITLTKEKLVSNQPDNLVMKLLNVYNSTVEVSETGAFKITATVELKEKQFIFGDVPAIVDGTILAHLYDGPKEIGTAKLVLPVDGVRDKVGVVGVGLSGAQSGKKYTIIFTPYKLWLMEA